LKCFSSERDAGSHVIEASGVNFGGAGAQPVSAGFRDRTAWLGRHVFPHEPALRRWLGRRELGGLDVDDIVQETYSRLVALPSVGHIDNPRTYMFQVAGSVILDQLRRARVVSFHTVAELEALDFKADAPSPEIEVLDRDQLRRLARRLAALPERVRQVFRLRRVDGLSQKEVAAALGISESTVEKHMARGALMLVEFDRTGGSGGESSSSQRNPKLRRGYVQGDRSRG
jgi:RNA polymerase sigma factor (sigma-70 family)